MTIREVTVALKAEMAKLTDDQLVVFAENMGVDTVGLIRTEIEDECVVMEQYVFTH